MKIKEGQLETIRKQQKTLNELLNNIGYMEAQKHGLLHQFNELTMKVEEFKTQLENEYGQININVETGEYTIIEDKDTASPKPNLKVVENVQ